MCAAAVRVCPARCSMGRNFEEIKRCVLGLQLAASAPIAIPVNWTPGEVRWACCSPHIVCPRCVCVCVREREVCVCARCECA